MKIKHLTFAYKKAPVLKDISLEFKQGKITTILGSNGCGKTTLFRLCTKELKAKKGLIKLEEKNISRINSKEFAKKVAIVHQQNKINTDITVYQLISYARTPYVSFMQRLTRDDYNKVDEAIELCNLQDIKDEKVLLLSGGQLQRVWIAMAIAQDTEIIFLDEPTTYLDIKYQIEILELIKNLNETLNKTFIMILHDINQSVLYSDYLVGLYEGHLEFFGEADKVLNEQNLSKIYDTPLQIKMYDEKQIILPNILT